MSFSQGFKLVSWVCLVKFALSAGLDNNTDYPSLHPPPHHFFSTVLYSSTPHISLVFLLSKDTQGIHFACESWAPRPNRAPCEDLIVFERSGTGVTGCRVRPWVPMISWVWREGGAGKGKGGGKRASTVIRLSPVVVPKPSLYVHSPFKTQNKYKGGDKP